MAKPININSKKEVIALEATRYRIYTLGGFGVNLGQFTISFKHLETGELIKCKRAFWPVQAFAYGKRAKRVFIVDIPNKGHFEIIFQNPETLKVKHSNLPIISMFGKPLPTDQMEVIITKKLGIYSILNSTLNTS